MRCQKTPPPTGSCAECYIALAQKKIDKVGRLSSAVCGTKQPSNCVLCIATDLIGISLAHLVGGIGNNLGGVVVGSVRGGEAAKQECNGEEDHDNDAELAQNGLASTKLGPVARSLTSIALDLVVAELVVDHAPESNRVAKKLQRSNGSSPDHHGGDNEHNILQDTAEG